MTTGAFQGDFFGEVPIERIRLARTHCSPRLAASREVQSFAAAHAILHGWSAKAPIRGPGHRVDVEFIWADGQVLRGSIELVHVSRAAPDLVGYARGLIAALQGGQKPANWSQEEYEKALAHLRPDILTWANRIAEDHQAPSLPRAARPS